MSAVNASSTATAAAAQYSTGKRCRALAALPPNFHLDVDDHDARDVDNHHHNDHEDGNNFDDVATDHRFVIGTGLLSSHNEMIELEYSEEDRTLQQRNHNRHTTNTNTNNNIPGEVWDLNPHPSRALMLATWASPTEGYGLSLLSSSSGESSRIPEESGAAGTRAAVFDRKGRSFCTAHVDGTVKLWGFADAGPVVISSSGGEATTRGTRDVCFDPHNANVILCSSTSGAKLLDVRESMLHECIKIETPTRCLTLDANPNRPHVFLTGGEDGQISFWDARITRGSDTGQQLLTFKRPHEHWVTKARYNPFHDQLVASASSDGTVGLWRAVSVSSTPLVNLDDDDDDDQQQQTPFRASSSTNNGGSSDQLVRLFADNLDSVYGLAWSAVNAWVLASMSYDGKVKVHLVPSAEKYKILL